jgi:hypothetical protein
MKSRRLVFVLGLLVGCKASLNHLPGDDGGGGSGGGGGGGVGGGGGGGSGGVGGDGSGGSQLDSGPPDGTQVVDARDAGDAPQMPDAPTAETGPDAKPGIISDSSTMFDFSRVEIGVQTAAKTWTITNTGDASTGALSLMPVNGGELVVTNGCTTPLAGHGQCTISVAVKASGGGPRSAMLTLTAAAGGVATLSITASAGYRLTVTPSGTGAVTSMPAGINCGSTCTAILDAGTQVTLQARTINGSGSFFSGWTGAGCSGPFHDCAVTLNASATVTATFSPMTNNLIFVTSGTFPTNEGSAASYDKDCNAAATAAGINDAAGTSYVAVTSDAATTVSGRLGSARGWARIDGKPFADNGLFSADQVFNPIRYTEFGQVAGTTTLVMGSGCGNYTGSVSDVLGCGNPEGGPSRWLDNSGATCNLSCNGSYRIICMGKSKTVALVRPTVAGRLVWVDASIYVAPGATTVTPPDQVCQAERPAGVTTAVAFLSYSNRAASTLLSPAMNYVRPDGTLVGTGAQLAAAGPIESGIWQSADGTYRASGGRRGAAWTGGSGGSLTSTCNDWSAGTGTGLAGDFGSTASGVWWNTGVLGPCGNVPAFFYCVQTAP